jgi:hypothetical protein
MRIRVPRRKASGHALIRKFKRSLPVAVVTTASAVLGCGGLAPVAASAQSAAGAPASPAALVRLPSPEVGMQRTPARAGVP